MVLLMVEGFEGLHTTEGNTVRQAILDELERKMTIKHTDGSEPFLRAGEVQGKALSFGDNASADNVEMNWRFPRDIVGETIVVGFRIKLRDHTTGGLQQPIVQLFANTTGAGDRQLELIIDYNDANKLSVRRAGVVVETEASGTLASNTWHHIEFKFNIHNTTGLYTVNIDDTEVLAATSVDTQGINSGANAVAWAIAWTGAEGTAGGVDKEFLIDDIYILDITGSVNNNFLGSNARVKMLLPTTEGTTINFTPQSGTNNALMVDENPPSNATYNDGATNTNVDEYGFPAIAEDGTIYAVAAQTHSEVDAMGDTRRFRHRARSGATVGTGADIDVADESIHEEFFEVDPNTSSAWTATNLDNAEFGVEVRD